MFFTVIKTQEMLSPLLSIVVVQSDYVKKYFYHFVPWQFYANTILF